MPTVIRDYEPEDEPDVVELSLAAWEPVFAGYDETFGSEINCRLHGDDWRPLQAASVRETLSRAGMKSFVAEADGTVVGFVSAIIWDRERMVGEIDKLAVDPSHQGSGTGTMLTETATDWLRQQGARVAMIGTGGDPGHAAARRTYEKSNYRLVPMARYFKSL